MLRITTARWRSSPWHFIFLFESVCCRWYGSYVCDSRNLNLSEAQSKRVGLHKTRMQLQFVRKVIENMNKEIPVACCHTVFTKEQRVEYKSIENSKQEGSALRNLKTGTNINSQETRKHYG